jgi:hypothetical protein
MPNFPDYPLNFIRYVLVKIQLGERRILHKQEEEFVKC